MRALICLFAGHRWRPYWTPGLTWRGRRCARCWRDEHGFELMLAAYDALPASDPLRQHFDEARKVALSAPLPLSGGV
jgi:hypothetical protein